MNDPAAPAAPAPARRRRRSAAAAATAAAGPQVFVRLYRARLDPDAYQGMLGDCYLIRIVDGPRRSTILIDCGMLLGSPDADARMAAIADDIVAQTGGTLDLLVVTHEHWDHISGFSQAQHVFLNPARLRIANLWMAWTEDPADAQAKALRARFDKTGTALAALAMRIASDRAAKADSPFAAAPAAAIEGLENFLGPLQDDGQGDPAALGAAATKRLTGRAILDGLKGAAQHVRYLEPGIVTETPGAAPLRAYVFGPPRDERRLFKDLPRKGDEDTLYHDVAAFNTSLLIDVAAGKAPNLPDDSPFSGRYTNISAADVKAAPDSDLAGDATLAWLRARYFDDHAPCRFGALPPPGHVCAKDLVCGSDQRRRRIDGDWLAAAGPLAMKLDSDTNNTSLVLAFELPDRTIMLFAADAQVGNWESWHDQDYVADGIAHKAADLLARTRFYKVGHHGSHNATLTSQGLELMTRPDLIAAISTDYELGTRQGSKGWQMPNRDVEAALEKRTAGRVIRADRDNAANPALAPQLQETGLFIELRVFG